MKLLLALHLVARVSSGSLGGTVTEIGTNRPLEGVAVEVVATHDGVSTRADGSYRLDSLEPGWQRVRFSRLGHRTVEVQAFIAEGSGARVDVALAIEPLRLPTLDVVRWLGRPDVGDHGALDHDVAHVGTKTLSPSDGHPLLDTRDLFERLSVEADVATRPEAGGGLHVRGGSSDQNLVLLDGAPILGSHHAFGAAGVINPDFVGAVELHAGVPPARYGGRLSSVVSLEARRPDLDRASVQTGVDGFTSHLTVDAPLVPGLVGAILSVRRGTGGVLGGLADHGQPSPPYWDAFAEGSTSLATGDLRTFVFRSVDRVSFSNEGSAQGAADEDNENANQFGWNAGTTAIRWARAFDHLRLDAVAWRATSASTGRWVVEGSELDAGSDLNDVGVRGAVRSERHSGWLAAGGGLHREAVRYGSNVGPAAGLTTRVHRYEAEAFGEWHQVAHDRFGWTLGLRTAAGTGGHVGVEPRVTVSLAPTRGSVLSAGYARSSQSVQSLANEESVLDVAIAAAFPGTLTSGGAATADQVTVAMQMALTPTATLSVESYARWMSDIVLVDPVTDAPTATTAFELGRGRASGVQASADHYGRRWRAAGAYRLSRARRTRSDGTDYRPSFDRTHWGSFGVGFRLSDGVTLRSGLRAGSGAATSPIGPGFQWGPSDPVLGNGDVAGIPTRVGPGLNGATLPPFISLDVGARATWERFVAGRSATISSYLSASNVLGRTNGLTFRRDSSGSLELIPLRPLALNVGVRIQY